MTVRERYLEFYFSSLHLSAFSHYGCNKPSLKIINQKDLVCEQCYTRF